MRVVVDTNTVVSAFLWGGPPARLLESARTERITLFSSAALIAELEDVLGRQKFAARIARVGSSVPELLDGYRALTTLVRAAALTTPVSRDPDDDHVLACALAAKAELIVSGDKRHLLILGEYQGIPIRTASQTLGQLTAPSPPQQ